MSEVKHTQGPWVWRYSSDEGDHVSDDIVDLTNNDYGCCYLAGPDGSANSETFPDLCAFVVTAEERPESADANLIAAAPELLEALEFMYAQCTISPDSSPHRKEARAAIAKAKGQA